MDKLQNEARKELKKLEDILCKIEEFQKNAPRGCLKYQNKGKKTYFYHQYWDEDSKSWERKYIKKENSLLPKELALKQYYSAIGGVLNRNVSALKNLIQQYHPENLRFETEQGEFVRSKSEVIIANILYQHSKDILYRYEKPLEVLVDRKVKTIYPDFAILNVHTGKIWYWEHAGRMDDPTYANEFVKKTNAYVANGFLPGKDVVFTYETMANPLEIFTIRRVVEEILVGE